MSHFTKLQIKFKDKAALLTAVGNLGYELKQVKRNEPCHKLRGTDNELVAQGDYYIPHYSLSSYAEVGFKWDESENAYYAVVDDYYNRRSNNKTTKNFRQNLSAEYTAQVAIHQGFQVKNRERLESGEIRYRFTAPETARQQVATRR